MLFVTRDHGVQIKMVIACSKLDILVLSTTSVNTKGSSIKIAQKETKKGTQKAKRPDRIQGPPFSFPPANQIGGDRNPNQSGRRWSTKKGLHRSNREQRNERAANDRMNERPSKRTTEHTNAQANQQANTPQAQKRRPSGQ